MAQPGAGEQGGLQGDGTAPSRRSWRKREAFLLTAQFFFNAQTFMQFLIRFAQRSFQYRNNKIDLNR